MHGQLSKLSSSVIQRELPNIEPLSLTFFHKADLYKEEESVFDKYLLSPSPTIKYIIIVNDRTSQQLYLNVITFSWSREPRIIQYIIHWD